MGLLLLACWLLTSLIGFCTFLALAVLARPLFLPENALGHFVFLGEF